MHGESRGHSVLRPLLLGLYAQLGALGCAMLITAVYATLLAMRARGTPDQALISAFAAWSSPWIMAVIGILLTFVFGRRLARETGGRPVAAALGLGATSGAISLLPSLVLLGHPSVRSLLVVACLLLASWAGAASAALRAVTPQRP